MTWQHIKVHGGKTQFINFRRLLANVVFRALATFLSQKKPSLSVWQQTEWTRLDVVEKRKLLTYVLKDTGVQIACVKEQHSVVMQKSRSRFYNKDEEKCERRLASRHLCYSPAKKRKFFVALCGFLFIKRLAQHVLYLLECCRMSLCNADDSVQSNVNDAGSKQMATLFIALPKFLSYDDVISDFQPNVAFTRNDRYIFKALCVHYCRPQLKLSYTCYIMLVRLD